MLTCLWGWSHFCAWTLWCWRKSLTTSLSFSRLLRLLWLSLCSLRFPISWSLILKREGWNHQNLRLLLNPKPINPKHSTCPKAHPHIPQNRRPTLMSFQPTARPHAPTRPSATKLTTLQGPRWCVSQLQNSTQLLANQDATGKHPSFVYSI